MCVLVLHGGEGRHEDLRVVLVVLVLSQRHVLSLHGVHAVLGDALVPTEALDLRLQLVTAAAARLTALVSAGGGGVRVVVKVVVWKVKKQGDFLFYPFYLLSVLVGAYMCLYEHYLLQYPCVCACVCAVYSLGIGEGVCSSLCLLLSLFLPPLQHGHLVLGGLLGSPLLLQPSLQVAYGDAVVLARRHQPVEPWGGGSGRSGHV